VLFSVPENLKTPEICLIAVNNDGTSLKLVPEHLRTPEMCLIAVQKNGFTIQCVPKEHMTEALCIEAVNKYGRALKYVPEQFKTEAVCLEAVKQDGGALEYVPENLKTEKLRNSCGAVNTEYKRGEKAMNYVPTTKENFFSRRKPAPDGKVLTETGYEITSEAVLALIKELKQFIVKNDVAGFWNLVHRDLRKKELTSSEKQCLLSARITEGGSTVFHILDDIDDLNDDGTTGSTFEIFSDLDDIYFPKDDEEVQKGDVPDNELHGELTD
jgi:hypothetical protein